MKLLRNVLCVLLAFCLLVTGIMPVSAEAAEAAEETVLTIKIGDKLYENVKGGSVIVGDFNVSDLEFWIVSVNGNALENVGSKSTAKDAMGRNPLEIATATQTKDKWSVTLIYHAGDDPVEANRAYEFSVAGITFANSDDAAKAPTVSKMSSVKATAAKKALKITWKKKTVSGYQIQYSTKSNFSSAKTVKVSKSKTSYTIKSLKANKKYYVRIRGYKTYTDDAGNKQTVYGKWTSVSKTTK